MNNTFPLLTKVVDFAILTLPVQRGEGEGDWDDPQRFLNITLLRINLN